MKIIAVGFLVSAIYGITKLIAVVKHTFDFASMIALICICIGVVVIVGCV
jgi:hypothetical protein